MKNEELKAHIELNYQAVIESEIAAYKSFFPEDWGEHQQRMYVFTENAMGIMQQISVHPNVEIGSKLFLAMFDKYVDAEGLNNKIKAALVVLPVKSLKMSKSNLENLSPELQHKIAELMTSEQRSVGRLDEIAKIEGAENLVNYSILFSFTSFFDSKEYMYTCIMHNNEVIDVNLAYSTDNKNQHNCNNVILPALKKAFELHYI